MGFTRKNTIKNKKEEKKEDKQKFISSGVDILDKALGKGIGVGTIINIVGDNSSGKTLLACEMIFKNICDDKGYVWYYDDVEAGFSFNTNDMYGYDLIPIDLEDKRTHTVEDFSEKFLLKINEAKNQNKKLIYIIDSLDALSTKTELESKQVNMKDRLDKNVKLNEFFRKNAILIEETGTILVVISQTRDNIGAIFGQKWRVSCEGALKFYAKQRIVLKEIQKIKHTVKGIEYPVGIIVQANVFKNKLGNPFKTCFFEILFNYGVDNIGSNLDYAFDFLTETGRPRKRIDIKWGDITFSSREELIEYIEENKESNLIKNKMIEKWDAIESELEPKRQKKRA